MKGKILIISGPSGSGKTSLIQKLLQRDEKFSLALSATTRKARPEERDGISYRFVSEKEFDRLASAGELLEQAWVHANRYGTLQGDVEKKLSKGLRVILDVDTVGAKSLAKIYPDALTLYLLPPSEEEWLRRLRLRGTETEMSIQKRLETARREKADIHFYQHVVVNDDLDRAVNEILEIFNRQDTGKT